MGQQNEQPGLVGNQAPAINGQPGSSVLVGRSYSFQPAASDPENELLTFTVANLPRWASFDQNTGRLSGTPAASDLGSYRDIRISVSDGRATASLPPFTINVVEVGTGVATLSWTPPTQNSDGTALTNLAGYEILYGQSQDSLSQAVSITNPSLSSYVIENLTAGTWYFAVTAVNSRGVASPLSNIASKTIS